MKIKIVTYLEIDKKESEFFTDNEIDKIYNKFRKEIKKVVETKDITGFKFINTDTNQEIENEVKNE